MKKKIVFFVLALILITPILFFIVYKTQKDDLSFEMFAKYLEQKSKFQDSSILVYKNIDFYKYIIYGTKTDDVHSDKLIVYLVKGSAHFGFDLSKIKIDKTLSDKKKGIIYASFESTSLMPLFVRVSIPESGIQEIETIQPQAYSEEEAKQIATTVAIVGSGLGGFAGGMLGGEIASFGSSLFDGGLLPKPVEKITGSSIGAGLGAIATGITSYICTKNFLLNYKAEGYGFTEVQNILQASKGLIALELLEGANLIHTKEELFAWENAKRDEQEKEISKACTRLFQSLGWKEVHLSFQYPKNSQTNSNLDAELFEDEASL